MIILIHWLKILLVCIILGVVIVSIYWLFHMLNKDKEYRKHATIGTRCKFYTDDKQYGIITHMYVTIETKAVQVEYFVGNDKYYAYLPFSETYPI